MVRIKHRGIRSRYTKPRFFIISSQHVSWSRFCLLLHLSYSPTPLEITSLPSSCLSKVLIFSFYSFLVIFLSCCNLSSVIFSSFVFFFLLSFQFIFASFFFSTLFFDNFRINLSLSILYSYVPSLPPPLFSDPRSANLFRNNFPSSLPFTFLARVSLSPPSYPYLPLLLQNIHHGVGSIVILFISKGK